jgi:hypothetical protein
MYSVQTNAQGEFWLIASTTPTPGNTVLVTGSFEDCITYLEDCITTI